MAYNPSFRWQVVGRIAAILASGYAAGYVATQTHFWLVSFWLGLLFIGLVAGLVRYVERSDRELANFLLSISQNDFSARYPPGKPGRENRLHEAFRRLLLVFGKLREEREAHHQYLQTVVEHVSMGLLAVDETGEVRLMNQAAKNLFRKPFLHHVHHLAALDPGLPDTLLDMAPGERRLRKLVIDGSLVQLSIQATRFKLHQRGYVLLSFHDIRYELEAQEVESWQKLIRVLTHEIMNSAIPISTLSSVVSDMLVDEKGQLVNLSGLDEENLADLQGSLRTIQSRSKGLVDFVQAYKSLTQTPKLRIGPVAVPDLFTQVNILCKGPLLARGIALHVRLPEEELILPADRALLEQVLLNLVGNAADALSGRPAGQITLSAGREEQSTWVRVADNGAGMSPEVQEQIFIPFYTTKANGSGIGLSLSKQIMLLHGGKIRVQSVPGQGSIFTLMF
jgi:nitrogen fixation/metabolism regulation signal transduction histidine kinase